ncbi:MAG: response regulator transcription factor [Ignavibacteriaceae bacterium]|nr:response regulator transcription factor [Ignavibacteriaceae bacterium]
MENKDISITIIEDHVDFREGLCSFISSSAGYQCAAVYGSVEDALSAEIQSDVLLLDIHLPGQSGIEAVPNFKDRYPDVKIIMMTVFDDDENIFNAILAGAHGYLLKKTPPTRILDAIRDVLEGGAPMSPYVAMKVISHFKNQTSIKTDYQLTAREKEILSLLVDGTESRAIAERLFISYETVRNHFKNIYQKLQVTSRVQAVSKAIKENLIK